MSSKVLVVAFTMPPYQDVGARRWAKFCKELVKLGHDVQVITYKFGRPKEKSNWHADTKLYEDRIIRLKSFYPRWLESPKTFFDKIMYRISLAYVRLFAKGNYYDKSSFTRKATLRRAEALIQNGYKNVIVTVAPFKLALWLSELKVKYPSINLIVDFRDPWIDNRVLYGLDNMPEKRRQYEIRAEETVAGRADRIITVADEMTSYFRSKTDSNKCLTIMNGFDRDDFTRVRAAEEGKSRVLKLVFVGSLYLKAMHHVVELMNALDAIKEEQPEVYSGLRFVFYGVYPANLVKSAARHVIMEFHEPVAHDVVYEKMIGSDACMTFLTDEITYCFNTKFFEYLSLQKPILIFSRPGAASRFVLENHLGYHFEPGKTKENLLGLFDDFVNGRLIVNTQFNLSPYDVKELAKQVDSLLVPHL